MRKLLMILLALAILTGAGIPGAFATEVTEETVYVQPERPAGYCGENITWSFSDGTLVLSGNGAMDDLTEWVPWAEFKDEIRTLIVTGNVTYIGANAFADYDALEEVNLGSAMTHIGIRAFKSCDSLKSVSLPSTFRRFGEESFMSCQSLTEFHMAGGMPSFNLNCLWDTWAKIYYPAGNPWPLQHIEQLESAFQGRIEFLASDGTDPYVPTLPDDYTEPTTGANTQPTEEPATEPTTQPATEPVTVPTEPETTAPEVTEAPETTEETVEESRDVIIWETVQPEEKPRPSGNGWIGVCIISGTLALVAVGALIFLRKRYD